MNRVIFFLLLVLPFDAISQETQEAPAPATQQAILDQQKDNKESQTPTKDSEQPQSQEEEATETSSETRDANKDHEQQNTNENDEKKSEDTSESSDEKSDPSKEDSKTPEVAEKVESANEKQEESNPTKPEETTVNENQDTQTQQQDEQKNTPAEQSEKAVTPDASKDTSQQQEQETKPASEVNEEAKDKQENLINNVGVSGQSELFETKFENYIDRAKELSKKQMSDDEVTELTEKAMSLIEDMRNQTLNEKLKAEAINLKYLDGKDFPDPAEHQGNSETDQKLVNFTIACNAMHKVINKELVQKIIAKSPLEMVSIIKELSVFYQFVSADPKSFGHGQFTERQDKAVTVFATNDAILRIMKGIVYKNLLIKTKIYKMSRLGSNFTSATDVTEEALNKFVEDLKRSTADDYRIAIYMPEAPFDLSPDDSEANEFKTTAKNYINEFNLSKNSNDKKEKRSHLNKAHELAKTLLGIIPNVKISTYAKVMEFCKVLQQKRKDLEEIERSEDRKAALKAKRDNSNYIQIEKFLICNSKLLDSFYQDPAIFDLIIQKLPEFVPAIGQEITIFLKSLGLIINSNDNFDKVVSLLREFAKNSPDGSYLMSPLISVAMEESKDVDFKKILEKNDFSKLENCKYLMIK